jgi:DNA primase
MDVNQLQLKQIVDSHLGASIAGKNGETGYFCPFCNHYKKKLQVNFVSEVYHCWVCNTKGRSIATLLNKSNAPKHLFLKALELSTKKVQTYGSSNKDTQVTLPEHYVPIWKGNANSPYFKNALHYLLEKRNLTKYDILKYQIGYCEEGEYGGMIIIPSYDQQGLLNYFVGRSFYNHSTIKHKNPDSTKDIIGFESMIDWSQPITIVEGAFDAITTKRNTIPLFGKKMLSKLKSKIIEQRVQTMYIALDPDAVSDAVPEIEFFINNG